MDSEMSLTICALQISLFSVSVTKRGFYELRNLKSNKKKAIRVLLESLNVFHLPSPTLELASSLTFAK